jgi:hypothetical protein
MARSAARVRAARARAVPRRGARARRIWAGRVCAYAAGMNSVLLPCVSCARHRRVEEHACPFCGAAGVEPPAPKGASRVALAAALAAVAACREPGRGADIYGAPPLVSAAPTGATTTAPAVASPVRGVKPNQMNALVLGSKPPWESADDAGAGDLSPLPTPRPRPRYGSPPDPARRDVLRDERAVVEAAVVEGYEA